MSTSRKKKSSNFIVQGSILAMASIICRLIGIVYRIPLTNIIGINAIGAYSSAYDIYSTMLLVSSFGIPTAVSKMVAARMSLKQYRNSNRVFKVALVFALISGSAAGLIMFFGADFFADTVLKMPSSKYAIQMLAPTVFIMAFLGVFRGYFQGLGTMIPSAISQLVEQVFNAVFSIVAAFYLYEMGVKADRVLGTDMYAVARGAEGATVGTGLGALMALLLCIVIYMMYRVVLKRQLRRDHSSKRESYGHLGKMLVLTLLPIIFNSAIYNISAVLDNSIFGQYAAGIGMDASEREGIWGCYSGQYHLLTHLPISIITAMASATVPTIARTIAGGSHSQVTKKINASLRFTTIIAIPSMVGLGVLGKPIMDLLFTDSGYNETAAFLLIFGGTTVVTYSISTITNAILQGINKLNIPVRNAGISLVLHLAVLAVCLFGFDMGINGVVVSDIVFGFSMAILNMWSLSRCLTYRQDYLKTYILPGIASAVMGVLTWLVYEGIYSIGAGNTVSCIAAIVVAGIVYAVILLLTRCVDEVDLYNIPKGAVLVSVAKKLHLLR